MTATLLSNSTLEMIPVVLSVIFNDGDRLNTSLLAGSLHASLDIRHRLLSIMSLSYSLLADEMLDSMKVAHKLLSAKRNSRAEGLNLWPPLRWNLRKYILNAIFV